MPVPGAGMKYAISPAHSDAPMVLVVVIRRKALLQICPASQTAEEKPQSNAMTLRDLMRR